MASLWTDIGTLGAQVEKMESRMQLLEEQAFQWAPDPSDHTQPDVEEENIPEPTLTPPTLVQAGVVSSKLQKKIPPTPSANQAGGVAHMQKMSYDLKARGHMFMNIMPSWLLQGPPPPHLF